MFTQDGIQGFKNISPEHVVFLTYYSEQKQGTEAGIWERFVLLVSYNAEFQ